MKFLTLQPEAFGIDISDLSLKIAKLKKKRGGLSLVSFGLEKIQPGIIKSGEIKDQQALTEIIKKSIQGVQGQRLDTKYVIASLPEEKSFLQIIQMPKLAKEELEQAVRFEAENYIPLPLEKVYLGFQKIKPHYNHLDHLDILIACMPKEIVDPYVESLKKAGLVPIALEIESQAIARALIKEEKSSSPILLIDFGETRSSFIIFSGCCVRFTSSIPISSQGLTQNIAKSLKVDFKKAETMKTKYGLRSDPKKENEERRKVFETLAPIMTEFVEQTKTCINYYQTHAKHEHLPPGNRGVKKILLAGGGANLLGFTDFLSSEIKIPVEVGNPWVNVNLKKKAPLFFKESLPYTTAIGLALRGLRK